jgi:rhodanese-related sulfurtransferase
MDLEQKDWTAKQKEYDNLVVLDVRTPEEYAEKRLPQAQILDINDARSFMEGLEQLDKSKAYFVYCRSGARSARACAVMQQYGFLIAFNLLGGILAWVGPTE